MKKDSIDNPNAVDELTRRQFVSNTALKFLGVTVAPMLGSSVATPAWAAEATKGGAGKAKAVIFLNMSGGMSHLDTFDLKQENQKVQGPVKGIKTTADGVQLSEYLPNLAKQAHHMAIINSMTTNQGAHEQGQYFIHRSYAPRGTIVHPSMGAWVMRLAGRRNSSIPGFVSIGGGGNAVSAGFFGSKYAGVPVMDANSGLQDVTRPSGVFEEDFNRRLSLADQLNQEFHSRFSQKKIVEHQSLYDEALKLMNSADLDAFKIDQESRVVRDMYGNDRFGQGCLLARRLVEHNVRFVEVGLGGWDTHYDNFTSVKARAAVMDKALAALLKDLERRGLLETTLVALATEFGRTPEIVEEHQSGRDHHPRVFSCVLAGGGIRGGQKYGQSDKDGAEVAADKVTPPMFNATIAHALGLPIDRRIMSPSGRPFWVSDKAPAVTGLFG